MKRIGFGIVALLMCGFYGVQSNAETFCMCEPEGFGSAYTYDFDYLRIQRTVTTTIGNKPANLTTWYYVPPDDMVNGADADVNIGQSRCCMPEEQHPVWHYPQFETYNNRCLVVGLKIPTQFATSVTRLRLRVSNEARLGENYYWFHDGASPPALSEVIPTEQRVTWCNAGDHNHACSPANYLYTGDSPTYNRVNYTNNSGVMWSDRGLNNFDWNNVAWVIPDGTEGTCKWGGGRLADNTVGASEYIVSQLQKRVDTNYY